MKLKNLLILFLTTGISMSASAQLNIGFTNLELVLAYLPETQNVQKELETYQKQLTKKLETKKNYFDVKYQEYIEKSQSPDATQASLLPLQEELQKLQSELQTSAAQADQDLAAKQNKLMGPIMEKLEKEIKAIAAEKGYTYILNSASSGSSIILHASQADDVSEALLARMGVEIPKADE